VSAGTPALTQIYGSDAIGTSIAISQQEFPTNGSAGAVVLARDDYFSDALAAGPLAASVDGPLLITEGAPISSTLDPRVQAEIQRVLPVGGTVYIIGGDLALSPNIDTTLEALGYTVVREAGADEYATAVDIAEQLGNPSTIFEATGLNFYDALSAVPAAIEEHAAILLTNGSSQSLETYVYIVEHLGDTRFAIGGPQAAAGADAGATPIYGQDLFNTSAAVASYFFPNASVFGAATAVDFPDALGGGVFMATGGRLGPILLVNPSAPLPPEITPYLATLAVGTKGYVFGGPLAVGPDVVTALQLAVG
jgi:putative cell wall-binding protein